MGLWHYDIDLTEIEQKIDAAIYIMALPEVVWSESREFQGRSDLWFEILTFLPAS